MAAEEMDVGEFAEHLAMLINRNLAAPDCYDEWHDWEIDGLDIGEIEIKTRSFGNFRLVVIRDGAA